MTSAPRGNRCFKLTRSGEQREWVAATVVARPRRRRSAAAGRVTIFVCASFVAVTACCWPKKRRMSPELGLIDSGSISDEDTFHEATPGLAFLQLDEKDGRFCGKDGEICKCFGHVRYGRLFTWSDDIIVDGQVNCSAAMFGDATPMSVKVCKCFPTICTTDVGTCTPEPCGCPASQDPSVEWVKKTLMTSDGNQCWACEKGAPLVGTLVDSDSAYCPTQIGRCTTKRSCKCENPSDTKRVMRTKNGTKCWTCATASNGGGLGNGQTAMFWMLPLLWPFMDFPNSAWKVMNGCKAFSGFCALCVVGYFCQSWLQFLRLDQYFSFFAPCMKKGEFWRLFTYFMLHSDLQHLCINLFHLMDALDLEGVPELEVSPGVPLRCTRDGPIAQICYPDVGIGFNHIIAIFATVLAYGALIGTIRNFTALVQGASSVCFGVDGALIALYGMFLGAGLNDQIKIPEFGAFFWMRIGIIFFHIIIDILQSVLGGGRDTVGTMAHMASLVAGFCYVILVLPPMGDGNLFSDDRAYIIECGLTSPRYVDVEAASSGCLAFFRRTNGIEVGTAQTVAICILCGGVLVSVVNMIINRNVSDDGVACCSSREMGAPQRPKDDEVRNASAQSSAERDARKDRLEEIENLTRYRDTLQTGAEQLQRLFQNMPDPDLLTEASFRPMQYS